MLLPAQHAVALEELLWIAAAVLDEQGLDRA
jgi:hypothetical protein